MSSTSRLASAPHRPLTGPPGSPRADTPADTPLPGATADRAPRAVAARRAFLVACPLLAGAFAVVAAVADPASGLSGRPMTELYIAHPDPLQWKSTGYHWAYAFWIAPALLLAGLVRGKGAWLANAAAVLGFAGMVTLPGMLIVDWYQSAVGQLHGIDATLALEEHMMATMWGPAGFMTVGMAGFVLGLPLAVAAQWRAGRMRWWAFAATLAAYAAFLVGNSTWWGCAVAAVFLAVLAVAIARATRSTEPA